MRKTPDASASRNACLSGLAKLQIRNRSERSSVKYGKLKWQVQKRQCRRFDRGGWQWPIPAKSRRGESAACGSPQRRAYRPDRSCGRVAEGGGLLNRYRVVKPYRGFESLRLRHLMRNVNMVGGEPILMALVHRRVGAFNMPGI
jgi:hypothetical protein